MPSLEPLPCHAHAPRERRLERRTGGPRLGEEKKKKGGEAPLDRPPLTCPFLLFLLSLSPSLSLFPLFTQKPGIFSSILASRVEPDPADPARLHIVQTCKWKWFLFGGAFEVRLAVSRAEPPGGAGGRCGAREPLRLASTAAPGPPSTPGTLVFTLVSSPFLRSFEGTWTVAPCPNEPGTGPAVVEHSLAVTPTLAPPSAAGGYVGRLFQKQVGGVLVDLGEELGRRAL